MDTWAILLLNPASLASATIINISVVPDGKSPIVHKPVNGLYNPVLRSTLTKLTCVGNKSDTCTPVASPSPILLTVIV